MVKIRPGMRYPRVLTPVVAVIKSAQHLVWRSLDLLDVVRGDRDPLTPPRHLMFVGTNQFFLRGDFNSIGRRLLQELIAIGGLQPDDQVLDVGCGVGRMAAQLTGYLSKAGRYDGFDIVAEGIEWCQKNIAGRFDNFHFLHADIFNSHYNPRGRYKAEEYRFPYPDAHFSFVFLTSVATHVLSAELRNYLAEIKRVLRPGGRCFITYFLINDQTQRRIDADLSSLEFRFRVDDARVENPESPEAAVAFDEAFIRHLYRNTGLTIREPIRYGSWSGEASDTGYQDIVVGTAS